MAAGSGAAEPPNRARTVIVGCGRVGAELAGRLFAAGQEVTIIDLSAEAFLRLPEDFGGAAVRGDGTDEDVLRRAGAEDADYLFALTEGDNRNVLISQLAAESLQVRNVVAKVNDPVRADAYTALGIATICRTGMMVDALTVHLGLPLDHAVQGVMRATGHHPGNHDEHRPGDHVDVPLGAAPARVPGSQARGL